MKALNPKTEVHLLGSEDPRLFPENALGRHVRRRKYVFRAQMGIGWTLQCVGHDSLVIVLHGCVLVTARTSFSKEAHRLNVR